LRAGAGGGGGGGPPQRPNINTVAQIFIKEDYSHT
jgi:hypothetical protein